MTKQFLGLTVAALFALHGEASAAQMFVDGPPAFALGTRCANGSALKLVAGFVVDPVAEQPVLGQSTVMHAMATMNDFCGDDVRIELFLPAGARFDPNGVVVCNLIDPSNHSSPLPTVNGLDSCKQVATAVAGPFGGLELARASFLQTGMTLEVRARIIFDQQVDDAPLFALSNTQFNGVTVASVLATAPFQPTPSPTAIGDDIGLLGSSSPGLPVAFSNDDGTFTVTDRSAGFFPGLARLPGVQRLSADFNGDGLTDYALVGGSFFQSIPIAFSDGNGKFTVTNQFVGAFGNMFGAASSATAVTGDFNHDGWIDIALVGGSFFQSIPVAFNLGGGNFNVTNFTVPIVPQLATMSGARPMVGDYNKDGFADIAIIGGIGANTIPIAFSFGNGQFAVTNQPASSAFCGVVCSGANFPFLARRTDSQVVTGDFNVDGFTDFAMTSPPPFAQLVVALNKGSGNFQVIDANVPGFANLAVDGAKLLTGDFNKDGYPDLVLVGNKNHTNAIPSAMNLGFGNFLFSDFNVPDFGSFAATPGVRPVVGDYNGDGRADIALTGGTNWQSIPVATSFGFGIFGITNKAVKRFPAFASEANTTAIAGHTDWN